MLKKYGQKTGNFQSCSRIAAAALAAALSFTSVCTPLNTAAAAKIKLDKIEAKLYVGGTKKQAKTTLKLKKGTKTIKAVFTSSKPAVAKVGKNTGVVTAQKEGTATIIAKYKAKKYKCKVTVEQYEPVSPDQPGTDTDTNTDQTKDETLRATQYGRVKGVDSGDHLTWYAIPYAAAPVGDLRWSKPADPQSWTEPLDCTKEGDKFLQCGTDYATGKTVVSGTEDCLNLDVYAPKKAEKLPVLVYIHGGNNQTGTSSEIKGHQIAVEENCVYVSLNYRLGLFGFNCLPALQKDADATGNYTLLDIAKALDWVKANISEFGGDAGNITVSGFSAGGRDVMAMLTSPLFAGKFDKAVVYSGGMTIADETASARQIAAAIAPLAVEDKKAADEKAAVEWLLTDGTDVKDYLYSIDSNRLVTLMSNAGIRMSVFPHLYGDDVVLPKEGFATTKYNSVPLLMLTGATEFSLFCNFDGYYFSDAFKALDETTQNAAKTFTRKYGSDMYRIFNAQCSAETMYKNYGSNIYVCQVEYGSDQSATKLPAMGSFHGIFVPMLTNDHTYSDFGDFTTEGYRSMSALFDNYLKNFLVSGNPNAEGQTEWANWTPENPVSMVLDADAAKGTAEQKNVTTTYEAIMDAMDADSTVPQEIKNDLISKIMNGRWFSDALDARYKNVSLWK